MPGCCHLPRYSRTTSNWQPAVTAAEELATAVDPALDATRSNAQLSEDLAADPSDYSVAGNNSIEIQASETLGHYADWLGVQAWDLRRLNNTGLSRSGHYWRAPAA